VAHATKLYFNLSIQSGELNHVIKLCAIKRSKYITWQEKGISLCRKRVLFSNYENYRFTLERHPLPLHQQKFLVVSVLS